MRYLAIIFGIVLAAHAQTNITSNGGTWTGNLTYGSPGQGMAISGENIYCPPSTGTDQTDQSNPLWGTVDGVANLPQRCMNTAMASTPSGLHLDSSPANTFTPATNQTLTNVLNSANGGTGVQLTGATGGTSHLSCGDTIVINAGSTYTGPFNFPAMSCDGRHWTIVRTSGTADPNFPAEGVRATPCIAGIANDNTHGRGMPGYPDYTCPSFGATLSAKIIVSVPTANAITFSSLADHYRFIGIEVTKTPNVQLQGALILMQSDPTVMGTNHVIFDRYFIHGEPWTTASGFGSETPMGVRAFNSQWIALINGWNVDTYCIAGCVDSHSIGFGTGTKQDAPFKIYGSVLATAGEQVFGGGGGNSSLGTPVPKDIEIRGNYIMKPLVWMAPIDTCSDLQPDGTDAYATPITKNNGEFKNASYVLVEGNYNANSWQGCQSDQLGVAFANDPANQNNHQAMGAVFDGTTTVVSTLGPTWSAGTTYASGFIVTYSGAGYISKQSGNIGRQPDISPSFWATNTFLHHNGTPDDTTCPVGGCVLGISDSARPDQNVEYHFCNGTNGCTQSGMNLAIQARIVTPTSLPPAGQAQVNACVPGDCPTCRAQHITYRYNDIFNVTNGIHFVSGQSSVCHDEAAGNDHIIAHDNRILGVSNEMSNGSDPYVGADAHQIASNTLNPISFIEIAHETVGIETGGGFGSQVDRSNLAYMAGLKIHDNLGAAGWEVHNASGSIPSSGVNADGTITNTPGLKNLYQIGSCKAYYPVEAPGGMVVPAQHSVFTFSPALSLYFVTLNGKPRAINGGFTTTGFTLTVAASDGDAITVRDMNSCDWTFLNNVLGTGLAGSGSDMSPYPDSNNLSCGATGTLSCILAPPNFTNLFGNYGTGRVGDFSLTGSNAAGYLGSASDAAQRSTTGKDPGADLTILSALLTGVAGSVFYPTLSITSSSIAGNLDLPLTNQLQASVGASPYKGWWRETSTANCSGNCGTLAPGVVIGRGGYLNGPFFVQTQGGSVGIASNVASIQIKDTLVAGANSWTAGQQVKLAGFCTDGSNPCTGITQVNDAAFNGTWSVVASGANCTNTISIVCLSITHADIAAHAPSFKGSNNPTVTFAPTTVGTYTWWMGARDGAFQTAYAPITLVVKHYVTLSWTASANTGTNGCCTYNVYRTTTSGSYGAALQTVIAGTSYVDLSPNSATTYYYEISATDNSGEGAKSTETTVVVP